MENPIPRGSPQFTMLRRKPASRRGVTRDRSSMATLAAECTAAIQRESGANLNPSQLRSALVVRLRDQHACTLDQIGQTLDITGERVRQLYQENKQACARSARGRAAPIGELSSRAIRGLTDAGLEPNGSLRDVALLIPALRLAARTPRDSGFNPYFRLHHLDRATVREIEEWLHRHGIEVDQ